jgi:hypothetical protein
MNELKRKQIEKMYQSYYSDTFSKVKEVNFGKRKETKVKGLVSWSELPAESPMYSKGILVGKEVM